MQTDTNIAIELCFVQNKVVELIKLQVPYNASIQFAIQLAYDQKLLPFLPEFSPEQFGLAIFGKKRLLGTTLNPGDRIEICAPLLAHPMDARRKRAPKMKINPHKHL
jgi:putative ubiquitin-RnfH superfamily antitoxin RatB of RatAB toxin-antitoxin module